MLSLINAAHGADPVPHLRGAGEIPVPVGRVDHLGVPQGAEDPAVPHAPRGALFFAGRHRNNPLAAARRCRRLRSGDSGAAPGLAACAYFAYGAFEMIFPLYAGQLGVSPAETGFLLGIQLAGMILLKPVFGRASDRFGRLPAAVCGFFACGVCFVLLTVSISVYAVFPLILIYGLGFALVTASTAALAADVARIGQLGASLGVLSTLMDVGQTFGPPAIGALSDACSYRAGIGALGVLFLSAAAGCAAALLRQRRRG
ncbi:MAG: MFS transporter [Clostridia bacterium]|nr:MFS transporter [Clostridia bacterium]